MNPARRPQSRKGRLAADALRQRRGGVKEYYYVEEKNVFNCGGRAGPCRRHHNG